MLCLALKIDRISPFLTTRLKAKPKILEIIFGQKFDKNLSIDAEIVLLIQDRRDFPEFFKLFRSWQ